MPALPRRTPVDFFEHLVEQFVVCETVPFDDFHNAIVCIADIVVNMDQADLIDIARESYPQILLEETTEILPAASSSEIGWL